MVTSGQPASYMAVSKPYVKSEPEEDLYDLALEVTQCHFHHTLFIKAGPGWGWRGGDRAETSPLGGGMARFGKSTCGIENTGPDVFGNFVLSQWVTGAGSVMCLCMADAVSKPWVEVTLYLKPFFPLRYKTQLGVQIVSGSSVDWYLRTHPDGHHPDQDS